MEPRRSHSTVERVNYFTLVPLVLVALLPRLSSTLVVEPQPVSGTTTSEDPCFRNQTLGTAALRTPGSGSKQLKARAKRACGKGLLAVVDHVD